MTKNQLIIELRKLRQRNAELEKPIKGHIAELSKANEQLNQGIEERKRTQVKLYEEVSVSLNREDDDIKICVEDDGIGFDIAEIHPYPYVAGGFGLFSIKERLQHLGGRFEIVSEPGQGTQVSLTVPLEQHTQTTTS